MSGFTEKSFYAIIKINAKNAKTEKSVTGHRANSNKDSASGTGDRENKGKTKEKGVNI